MLTLLSGDSWTVECVALIENSAFWCIRHGLLKGMGCSRSCDVITRRALEQGASTESSRFQPERGASFFHCTFFANKPASLNKAQESQVLLIIHGVQENKYGHLPHCPGVSGGQMLQGDRNWLQTRTLRFAFLAHTLLLDTGKISSLQLSNGMCTNQTAQTGGNRSRQGWRHYQEVVTNCPLLTWNVVASDS
jgi:hypothetical protein